MGISRGDVCIVKYNQQQLMGVYLGKQKYCVVLVVFRYMGECTYKYAANAQHYTHGSITIGFNSISERSLVEIPEDMILSNVGCVTIKSLATIENAIKRAHVDWIHHRDFAPVQKKEKDKNKSDKPKYKTGGSVLTSIYYTGQKIQGGYNTHKG